MKSWSCLWNTQNGTHFFTDYEDAEDTCRVLNTAFLQFSNLESIYLKFDFKIDSCCDSV